MPLYAYRCESCGREKIELRNLADRDEMLQCECGGQMKRKYSSSFSIELKTVTGFSKISLAKSTEPIYVRKKRDWTPPREFLEKKMPKKIF